jgi:DNA-binding response OmpR family regulator
MSEAKILIIEDDADVRLGLEVLLNAHHYRTFFAADAVAALVEANMNAPDLIILDLGLPAIDGFDVLRHFGDLFLFMVPVVVLSARELEGNREKALKAGAKAYLQKPWNDKELLAVISRELAAADLSAIRPK